MSTTTITPELTDWRIKQAAAWLYRAAQAENRARYGSLAIDAEMREHAADCRSYAHDYLNGRFDNEAGAR